MKTLVNKANPAIRITVPEIDRVCLSTGVDAYNVFIVKQWPLNSLVFFDTDWTLVEEKSKYTEVWVEGRTIFEQDAKKPEVDLEEEIEKAQEHYFALKDKGFSLDSMDVSVLARHFYELGRKGGSK